MAASGYNKPQMGSVGALDNLADKGQYYTIRGGWNRDLFVGL